MYTLFGHLFFLGLCGVSFVALLIEGLSQNLCADQDVDLYPDPSFHLLNEPSKYCALYSRSIPAFNNSKPICLYLEKSTKCLLTGHDVFFLCLCVWVIMV